MKNNVVGTVAERFHFHKREQEDNENIPRYVAALRKLSEIVCLMRLFGRYITRKTGMWIMQSTHTEETFIKS